MMLDVSPNQQVLRHGMKLSGLITYEDVLKNEIDSDGTKLNSVRLPKVGNIIADSPISSLIECKRECQKQKKCKSFNFAVEMIWKAGEMVEHSICQLLDNIPGLKYSNDEISGVMMDRYVCISH